MINYNDGKWYGWNGGECPVHPKTQVHWVHIKNYSAKDEAGTLVWGGGTGIVAFRVVKEHREPREFWLSKHNHNYILAHKPESNDPSDFIHVREVLE